MRRLILRHLYATVTSVSTDDTTLTEGGYAAYPGGHAEGYPDTFLQLFRDYYNYIEAGQFSAPRKFPTFSTGHEELLLCEAIQKSAQLRSWTKLTWD
jgi:hypothetical protein